MAYSYDRSGTFSHGTGVPAVPLSLAESAVVVAILVIISGMLPTVIIDLGLGLPNLPKWPLYLLLYAVVGLMLVLRAHIVVPLIGRAAVPLAFCTLPLISVLWSVSPMDTFTQSLTLMGTTLVGLLLGAAIPPAQALVIAAIAASINPVLDLAAVLALPSIGIEQDGPWVGTWRGLHEQKNALGALCALSLMILVTYRRANPGPWPWWLAVGLVVNVVMWIAARSTTSWLVGAMVLSVALIPKALQARAAFFVPIGLLALSVFGVAFPDAIGAALETLPGLVGKDSTLSNRLPIWLVVQPYIDDAYWLGHGYIAFWSDAYLPRKLFQDRMYFVPTSAHSSYVEMRLGFGVVGMVLLAFILARYIWTMWTAFDSERRRRGSDPLLPMVLPFLLYWLFQSITESIILNRNDLIWVLFVWLSIHTGVLAARPVTAPSLRPARAQFVRRATVRRLPIRR